MLFEKYKITLLFIENAFKSFHINKAEFENTKGKLIWIVKIFYSKFSNNKTLTIKTCKHFIKGLNELISNF